MSRRNYFSAALVVSVLLFVTRASASDTVADFSAPATNRPAFKVSLRDGETVGDHQIQRAFLNVGTNQIAFIIPTGFFMNASDPQKIVLSDNTGTYFITVRVMGPPYPDSGSQSVFFKNVALARFPGAKISSESSEFAANHSGPAFNLDWAGPGGAQQSVRAAFIPCTAGVLEFSILTRASKFKDAQMYLSVLMASVRSNETGKLVIVPLPDFS